MLCFINFIFSKSTHSHNDLLDKLLFQNQKQITFRLLTSGPQKLLFLTQAYQDLKLGILIKDTSALGFVSKIIPVLTLFLWYSGLFAINVLDLKDLDQSGLVPHSVIYLLEDTSRQITDQSIGRESAQFKPFEYFPSPIKRNYDHPWWVKLQIRNSTDENQERWLDLPGDIVKAHVINENGEHLVYIGQDL